MFFFASFDPHTTYSAYVLTSLCPFVVQFETNYQFHCDISMLTADDISVVI